MRIAMLRTFAFLVFLLCAQSAWAACGDGASTCWWVGGGSTANWNATGNTNWGSASNTRDNVGPPAAGDHICFDGSANGNTASTLNTAFSVADIDFSGCGGGGGSYSQTLTHNASVTLTISGNDAGAPGGTAFKLVSGMTYAPPASNRAITFTATSGTTTILSAGKSLGNVTINGAGGNFVLSGNLTTGADANASLTVTAGTFDANGANVTVNFFGSSNSNTRTVTMGSGTWTVTGATGTVWDYGTTTNLTHTATTSNLVFSATATGQRTFSAGGKTFGTVTISDASSIQPNFICISTTSTLAANLTLTGPLAITFTQATTFTISTALTVTGTSSNPVFIHSSNAAGGVNATIAAPASTAITWAMLKNMTFTGSPTATNSMGLGTSGITISAPSGGGGRIIGGWLLDAANDNRPMFLPHAA